MVSFCLQDKVQTAWQGTHVFYDLALCCSLSRFSLHMWPSSPPQEAERCGLSQEVCALYLPTSRETGGWERKSQGSLPGLPPPRFVSGSIPLPEVHTDWVPSCSCSSQSSGCSSLQWTVRPRGHNEFQLWLVPGELRHPLGFL